MSEVVRTEVTGAVAHVLLNRPEAMNAITVELGAQLERSLSRLGDDKSVHVIILRGAGGNFSVGGDFTELRRLRAEGPEALQPLFDNFGRACALIADLQVPVVAVVEGYALAGGFELMQSCDIVLVHQNAKIADTHSNFGQIPGGGSTQRLPRIVGRQRALAHILTGDRLSGAEAATWGLAYRAVPARALETTVDELAAKLAGKAPAALRRIKHLVDAGLEGSLCDGLALERATVLEHLRDASAAEGIEAFKARA